MWMVAMRSSETGRRGQKRAGRAHRTSGALAHKGVQRMDHVGIVVNDLAAAIEFFLELGLVLVGETPVEGRWVDRAHVGGLR